MELPRGEDARYVKSFHLDDEAAVAFFEARFESFHGSIELLEELGDATLSCGLWMLSWPPKQPVACSSSSKRHLEEYGFVVFHDVLTPSECGRTVDEIWASLEERTPGTF